MKRLIKSDTEIEASKELKKLKRTPESGHDYESDNTFETIEDYLKWWEEDELYED